MSILDKIKDLSQRVVAQVVPGDSKTFKNPVGNPSPAERVIAQSRVNTLRKQANLSQTGKRTPRLAPVNQTPSRPARKAKPSPMPSGPNSPHVFNLIRKGMYGPGSIDDSLQDLFQPPVNHQLPLPMGHVPFPTQMFHEVPIQGYGGDVKLQPIQPVMPELQKARGRWGNPSTYHRY
jgi:hypothetical protein